MQKCPLSQYALVCMPHVLCSRDLGYPLQKLLKILQGLKQCMLCRILRLAGPIALQDVMILLQSAISVAFVGRLGASSLSAMTLATSVFNVTGVSSGIHRPVAVHSAPALLATCCVAAPSMLTAIHSHFRHIPYHGGCFWYGDTCRPGE